MDILFTSDLHVSSNHLSELLKLAGERKIDALIIGGDLVPREHYADTIEEMVEYQRNYLEKTLIPRFEEFLDRNPNVRVFLDMGNDDFAANRDVLEKRNGELFNLLHMEVQELADGVDVVGYMCVPPTPFSLKDWEKPDSEEEPFPSQGAQTSGVFTRTKIRFGELKMSGKDTIENDLEKLSRKIKNPFLFVSHTPPYGTDLDVVYGGNTHVGSRSVTKFIEKWAEKGLLIASFHGHIHEAPEVTGLSCVKIGNSLCYNPGQSPHELRYLIFELTI